MWLGVGTGYRKQAGRGLGQERIGGDGQGKQVPVVQQVHVAAVHDQPIEVLGVRHHREEEVGTVRVGKRLTAAQTNAAIGMSVSHTRTRFHGVCLPKATSA